MRWPVPEEGTTTARQVRPAPAGMCSGPCPKKGHGPPGFFFTNPPGTDTGYAGTFPVMPVFFGFIQNSSSPLAHVQTDRTREVYSKGRNRETEAACKRREKTMNILATESFGSRSSIRSLKAPAAGACTPPDYVSRNHAPFIQENRTGGEPGNPLPCQ